MYELSSFDDKKVQIILFRANRYITNLANTERIEVVQSDYNDQGVKMVAIKSDHLDLPTTESYPEVVKITMEWVTPSRTSRTRTRRSLKKIWRQLTSQAFLFDKDRRTGYPGMIDDSPRLTFMTTSNLRNALDVVLAGRAVRVPETNPFDCAIDMFVSCP